MKISGLIELKNLSLITVTALHDHAGLAGKVLEQYALNGINLEYITEGSGKGSCIVMSFCVAENDRDRAVEIAEELLEQGDIKTQQCIGDVAFIGIYGPHFREKPGLAHRLCHALGQIGINILGISTSISTVSCIIRSGDFEKARTGLLEYFDLS